MQRSTAVRFTYQDLLSLPENESRRHEILDGKLYVTPGPRFDHQRVATNLLLVMAPLARGHGLGEVVGPMTVHVRDELVFEPDLIFIRADRMHVADPVGHLHGLPDLVIEILSPSTRSYDRALKRKYYMEAGVAELWLVDIDERMVEVWRKDRKSKHPHGPKAKVGRGSRADKEGAGKGQASRSWLAGRS